jgi:hypothetical protein
MSYRDRTMNTYGWVVLAAFAGCVLPVAAVFVAGLWGHASAALFFRTVTSATLVFNLTLLAAGVRWPRRDR